MTAAVAAGVRRLVYTSSIYAVSGYPPDVRAKTDDPVNPGDLYGVTKCFGEAMDRYVAEQEGLSVININISIRIGAGAAAGASAAGGERHAGGCLPVRRRPHQLLERCIETPEVGDAVVHGLSGQPVKSASTCPTRPLTGYEPVDDAAALNELVPPELLDRSEHDAGSPEQRSGLREDLPDP